MSEELEKKLNVASSNVKCKNCGSNVVFDPKTQSLVCPNCDSHFPFDKKQEEIKHKIEESKEKDDTKKHDSWAKEMKVVKCDTCGAEIILSGLEISKTCPYCGSDYVTEQSVLPGLKPDVVIPFMFNESDAGDYFVKGIKKKFFAPRALKKKLPANKIHGIYVPTFTFDSDSVTKYQGVLLRVETHRDSKGRTTTVTKRIPISGIQECTHRDYVVETSTKINNKQMNGILPYDFSKSYVYDNNFVRGYSIEHYEDRLSDCYDRAKEEMKQAIRNTILAKYSYNSVDYLNMDITYSNELYSYRMLPIYSFEFEWKNKKYMTLMNGQTGKVGGGYPKSPLKIALTVLAILIVIALIIVLIALGGSK